MTENVESTNQEPTNPEQTKGKRGMGSIVRIDQPKADLEKGTHGWQVRVPSGEPKKYHSKLFSDSKYDSKDESLVAAEEYLVDYREKNPIVLRRRRDGLHYRKKLQVNNTSGKTGVYRTYHYFSWDKARKRRFYWEAFCPIGPDGQRNRWGKRFYVDTYGEDEAKRRAIEFREMWEVAATAGEEALKQFFAEHHDGVV